MTLVARPTIDSDAAADRWRRLLLVPYELGQVFAAETMQAIATGGYEAQSGAKVAWHGEIEAAKRATRSIPPETDLPHRGAAHLPVTAVTVANESSLGAARAMWLEGRRPLVLNMANGVAPGGGFLHGARAQEEYLCRNSALYATLADDPMYEAHRRRDDYESSDWAILSPDVPVFRDDESRAIDQPWPCSFVSSAAPVATRVGQPRASQLMEARIDRVLQIAAAHGYTDLVLGAWGCGAFGNDPHATADAFHAGLTGAHEGMFDQVVFAITDWSPERRFLGPFRDRFQ